MTDSERAVTLATIGLAAATLGAFLPWARIGGRSRSGFSTADTFIGLANGVLPDSIAWIGRWWYLPAFLAVLAWATTFARGHLGLRATGVALIMVGLLMWWIFVWAADNWNVLQVQLVGPIVATCGLGLVAVACSRPRASMLRPHSRDGSPSPD